MQCWTCGAAADGVCRFCGRGVCKEHARTKPFLFETWEDGAKLRALAVDEALHCGICRPKPEPVDAEFLRRQPAKPGA